MTLSSCDPDSWTGYSLEGVWKGNLYSYATYNGQKYEASYTEIEFNRDPCTFTSGTGYWQDQYSNCPIDTWSSYFTWTVQNGVIRIHFRANDGYIEIHDYQLYSGRFKGWFYDDDNTTCEFYLDKVYSPNWDYDTWTDGWDYDEDYYGGVYAKSATPDFGNDSTAVTKTEKEEPVHHFKK